jgi:hypothetical protein
MLEGSTEELFFEFMVNRLLRLFVGRVMLELMHLVGTSLQFSRPTTISVVNV